MKAMIVRFRFDEEGAGSLEDWQSYVVEEAVPRFERHRGLRHKAFLWRAEPPTAVVVYVFADERAFAEYAEPLVSGLASFRTSDRFGAPAEIELLEVAGVADGPASALAPGQ